VTLNIGVTEALAVCLCASAGTIGLFAAALALFVAYRH
jgi:hypothetical protein